MRNLEFTRNLHALIDTPLHALYNFHMPALVLLVADKHNITELSRLYLENEGFRLSAAALSAKNKATKKPVPTWDGFFCWVYSYGVYTYS